MQLPEVIRTPDGFSVEGAGPDLLRELLAEFAAISKASGFDFDATQQPGLSRQQIVDAWAPYGVTPPEEAIVWWGWKNGYRPDLGFYPGTDQVSVQFSTDHRDLCRFGDGWEYWDPAWIVISGDSDHMMIDTAPSSTPPRVRSVRWPWETKPDATDMQVVSLCTPVTWWIMARRNGWTVCTPDTWTYNQGDVPPEWVATQLSHY